MRLRTKSQSETYCLVVFATVALLPLAGFAQSKPMMTTDILQHLRKGEPWDRGVFAATKMVMFRQTSASSGTNATVISKITLSYFTSSNCTATNGTSVPTYTTPDGTSFTISTTRPFGMVAASAWNVGNSKVSPDISTSYPGNSITNIQSIAVTFKSTNNNTPQANFTGVSFACVPVTCTAGPSGQCTSTSSTQDFQLKTTAAIGDPADGGVIACMNAGLNNLVAPVGDNNSSASIAWGGSGTTTNATSTTDGATNTTTIVAALGSGSSYAARVCSTYSAAGGFTSGWFLPAGSNTTASGQLNCLYTNRAAIGNFTTNRYWSSTESGANAARSQSFNDGSQFTNGKGDGNFVRCVRTLTL